jgi:hypothetical protein
MKTRKLIIPFLLTCFSVLAVPAVLADEGAKKDKPPSKTTLKRFDKDKDGVLNEAETAAWEADKQKQKEKRAEKKKAKEAEAAEASE